MSDRSSDVEEPADFSLVLGGPLYQLYLGTRVARPPIDLLHRRIIVFGLITWLPLLVVTLVAGHAIAALQQRLGVPPCDTDFSADLAAYADHDSIERAAGPAHRRALVSREIPI